MAYEPFPVEPIAITDLRLDLSNYRISGSVPSEDAAITYLFAEDDVESLARQILLEGYVDLEFPLVVRENQRIIVLEGNRRVTALKALLDPSLAPPDVRPRLERLLIQFAVEAEDLPDAIRVMVAPTREDTAVLLARLHIGRSKKGWGRAEQSRFVMAQLEAGKTITELKRELPGIKNPVTYVKQHYVNRLLRETPFSDPKVAEYATSKLTLTSFEYAYGNAEIQRVVGLEFDEDGVLKRTPSSPEEVAAFDRLVTMYHQGKLSSRKFPKRSSDTFQEDMASLVSQLRGQTQASVVEVSIPKQGEGPLPAGETNDLPGATLWDDPEGDLRPTPREDDTSEPEPSEGSGEGFSAGHRKSEVGERDTYLGTSANRPGPELPAIQTQEGILAPPQPNDPDTRKRLTITVNYVSASTGIQKRFSELRKLAVAETPIAAAVLIRSIIEASIKFHFSRLPQSKNVSGELGPVMRVVKETYGKEPSLRNVIDLLNNNSSNPLRPGSLRWFNNAAHDANFSVREQEVRDAWQQVEPIIQFMLKPLDSAAA